MDLSELKIDPEFEEKIPPLTQKELELLEQNIVSDGRVLDPLIVWNNTILDGHNRYRILMKHPEIPFVIYEKEFADKYAAVSWIYGNQLGRRNLTEEQRRYLIGKLYEAEKQTHGGLINRNRDERSGQFTTNPQNEDSWGSEDKRTSVRIAEENNVSRAFVERAEHFAKGVDAAEEVLPGIKWEILSGSIRPTQAAVAAVASAEPEKRTALAELLRQPRAAATNDDEDDLPVRVPNRTEILELAESMNHSAGQALGTVDDMIYEMRNALEDLIFRWDFCREAYAKPVKSRDGKRLIRELAEEGITYLKEIRRGALWKDAPAIEREEKA